MTSTNTSVRLILCLLLPACYSSISAQQVSSELSDQLKGLDKVSNIMDVVEQYYSNQNDAWRGPDGDDPKLKHWYRWSDYMSSRTDAHGRLVDIAKLNNKARKQTARMQNAQTKDINAFWDFIGPNDATGGTGRVDRIAFHPSIPGIIYVGTPAGGVWYSDNNGDLWLPISDHIPSTGISGIVLSHTTTTDVYVLTGDGDSNIGGLVEDLGYMRPSVGVIKSANGGNSWFARGEMSANTFTGYKLIQDPNDENILIAATSDGIYRTTDGAQSWTQVATGKYYDVDFRPGSSDTVYAVNSNTFFVSSDSGKVFSNISTFDMPIQGTARLEMGVTPADPDYVYLLAGGVPAAGQFAGFYRSTDGGINFEQRTSTPNILGYGFGTGAANQVAYDLCMDVSPTDRDLVYTGGVRTWKTEDGGNTFIHIQDGHEDVHDIKINPHTGVVFIATDGGIYRATENDSVWNQVFAGMGTSQSYNMRVDPADPERILCGTQDNGVHFRTSNTDFFERLVGGDGYDGTFAAGQDTVYVTRNRQLYMYSAGGTMSHTIFTPDSSFFGNIVAHQTDPNTLFLGKGSVWRSDDAGASWDSLGVSGFWDIETCPSNSNRVYTTGGNGLVSGPVGFWRSDNLGDDWFSLHDTSDFPDLDSVPRITEIGVRPTASTHVWITIGGFIGSHKVFRTLDGGGTWENMTANLPNTVVNSIAITPGNDAYIGTDIGVFYRGSDMDEWMPWSNNLPITPVAEVALAGDKLYAATFGRGVWESDLAEECYSGLLISGSFEGEFHYEADNTISSTAEIYHGLGTKVTYKAGTSVHLMPGFQARRITVFKAVIGPCGEGGNID